VGARSVQDDAVRIGIVAATVLACAGQAAADDHLEASAFFGGQYFGSDIGLGQSKFAEQRPQTSPLVGARLTVLFPRLAGDDKLHLDLGVEAELAMAMAFTGYDFDTERDSYFAPVFGYRGDLLIRLSAGDFRPHLTVGGGGTTISSSSPYMVKETVGEFLWGAGITVQANQHWQIRLDGKMGFLPAAMTGASSQTFEGSIGIGTRFGFPQSVPPVVHVEPPPPRPAPPIDVDSDGDGIPDSVDKCPKEAETINGIDDGDGCPEPDVDGDGIIGAKDQCPNEPEDKDGFQDEDGCPDPDNDGDGVPDIKDKCPNEPETKNGFQDDDGCPDTVPADLDASFAAVAAAKFEAGKPRVTDNAKKALDKALTLLRSYPGIHVTLTVHPDKGDPEKMNELAKKRGNATKGYLEEQGVGMDQITVVVSPDVVKPKGPTIEMSLPKK